MKKIRNSRAIGHVNNPHNDPSPSVQYLSALNQLFAYNNTSNNADLFNTNSYDAVHEINTLAELNCHDYWGHYAGHYPLASPRLNVHIANHYGFCIDTNTYNQLNTSVTDFSVHPDAGNTVFLTCICHVPFDNCSVDVSLVDNTSVLCILDFIESLDAVNIYQVVFVHDLRGHSSGFYYIYQDNDSSMFLHTYCNKDLGPFQVVGSSLANVVFCNHTLAVNANINAKSGL